MKVVVKSCPNCRAPIDEQSRFCSHCGTHVEFDDDTMSMKYTYQKVDDARIREADVREKIRLKELEIEALKLQSEVQQKNSILKMKLIVLFGFFIALIVIFLSGALNKYNTTASPSSLLSVVLMVVMAIVLPKVFRNK